MSPVVTDNTTLAGAVTIDSQIPGDLFIDGYKAGSWTTNATVELKLTLGKHRYSMRGNGVIIEKTFSVVTPTQGVPALPGLAFQASAGTISAPFVISNSTIYQTTSTGVANGGRASYSFMITDADEYAIEASVSAPSTNENSFYVNVDAEPQEPSMEWNINPLTHGFEVRLVTWRGNDPSNVEQSYTKFFSLASGVHHLIIRGKAPNVALRNLRILQRPSPPQNLHIVGG